MKMKINTIQSQQENAFHISSVFYMCCGEVKKGWEWGKSCECTKAIKNFFTVLWLLFLFIHSLIITNESINLAYNKNNEL